MKWIGCEGVSIASIETIESDVCHNLLSVCLRFSLSLKFHLSYYWTADAITTTSTTTTNTSTNTTTNGGLLTPDTLTILIAVGSIGVILVVIVLIWKPKQS